MSVNDSVTPSASCEIDSKLVPEPQCDVRITDQRAAQVRFELRLVEEIVVGPAEWTRPARRAEIANDLAAMRRHAGGRRSRACRGITQVDDAGGLKQPHHLVIDMHRARLRVRFELALDDHGAQTRLAAQVGGQRANGAAADDGDVVDDPPASIAGRDSDGKLCDALMKLPACMIIISRFLSCSTRTSCVGSPSTSNRSAR